MPCFKVLFLLFITYSMLGWIMEMIVTVIEDKEIVNRGFLVGPYCPIYGFCSVAMVGLLSQIESIPLLIILSILICSVGEYLTSYLLEKIFHARWWDYSHIKFNLNGRICLRNCIFFGALGFIVVKYVNNIFLNFYNSLSPETINIIFYIILIIFVTDMILSFNVIFKIKNMSLKYVNLDNTKEIANKVKNILTERILSKRLFSAFPYLRKSFKEKIQLLINKKR